MLDDFIKVTAITNLKRALLLADKAGIFLSIPPETTITEFREKIDALPGLEVPGIPGLDRLRKSRK